MTVQMGSVRNLGVGQETAGGTPVVPTHWIPITNGVVMPLVEYVEDLSNYGRQEQPHTAEQIVEDAVFNGDAVVRSDWIGVLLANIIGVPTSALAGGESVIYDHTFLYSNGQHVPMTVAMKDAITDELSSFAQVNSMELTVDAKEILRANLEIMGKSLVSDSNTVAYSTSAKRFPGTGVVVGYAADIAGLSSPTLITPNSLSLKFDQGLLMQHVLNSNTASKVINQTLRIEGEIELLQENNTLRDFVTDGTKKALAITITNPDTIGVGSNAAIAIQLADISFQSWETSDTLEDAATEKIGFVAHYDPTDASPQMLNVVLTNDEDGDDYRIA